MNKLYIRGNHGWTENQSPVCMCQNRYTQGHIRIGDDLKHIWINALVNQGITGLKIWSDICISQDRCKVEGVVTHAYEYNRCK